MQGSENERGEVNKKKNVESRGKGMRVEREVDFLKWSEEFVSM